VLVVAGLLCLTVADSSLHLCQPARHRSATTCSSTPVRVAGFILIALAPFGHQRERRTRDEVDGPSPWQVALPYLFLAIAIFAAALKTPSPATSTFSTRSQGCASSLRCSRASFSPFVENLRLTSQMR